MKRKWAKKDMAPASKVKLQARSAAMIGLIISTGATHLIVTSPGDNSAPADRPLVHEPLGEMTAKTEAEIAGSNVNVVSKTEIPETVAALPTALRNTTVVEPAATVFVSVPTAIEQKEQTRQTPKQSTQVDGVDIRSKLTTPDSQKSLSSSVATDLQQNLPRQTESQAKLLQVLRVNRLVRQLKHSQAVASKSGSEAVNRRQIALPVVLASDRIGTQESVIASSEVKSTWTEKQKLLIDRLKQKENHLQDKVAHLSFEQSKSADVIAGEPLKHFREASKTQTAASLGLLPGRSLQASQEDNSPQLPPATVFVIPAITPTNNQVVVTGVASEYGVNRHMIARSPQRRSEPTKTNHLDNSHPQLLTVPVSPSNTEAQNINRLKAEGEPGIISYPAMGGNISDDDSVVASPPPNVEALQQEQSASAQALLSNQYVQLQTDIQKLRQKYQTESVVITQALPSRNQTVTKPATALRTTQKLLRTRPAKSPAQAINPEWGANQAAKTLQPNEQKQQYIPVRTQSGLATAPLGTDAASLRSLQERNVSPALPPLGGVDNYLPKPLSISAKGLIWPARGKLTSGYGWRWGRMHKGVDIAAPIGTPIMAAAAGTVVKAGWNSGGYGIMVDIQHTDGTVTRYAHNKRILVQAGQVVQQGQQISEMGNTGFSTGPHLHFEVHPLGKKAVNPIAYLPR